MDLAGAKNVKQVKLSFMEELRKSREAVEALQRLKADGNSFLPPPPANPAPAALPVPPPFEAPPAPSKLLAGLLAARPAQPQPQPQPPSSVKAGLTTNSAAQPGDSSGGGGGGGPEEAMLQPGSAELQARPQPSDALRPGPGQRLHL